MNPGDLDVPNSGQQFLWDGFPGKVFLKEFAEIVCASCDVLVFQSVPDTANGSELLLQVSDRVCQECSWDARDEYELRESLIVA